MADWTFEWLRSGEEVESKEFLNHWQSLTDQSESAHIFQEPRMALAWLTTRGEAQKWTPAFCVARHADGTAAILPLCCLPCCWRKAYSRRAVALGEPNFDYQCPVVARADRAVDWPAFWSALRQEVRFHTHWLDSVAISRLEAGVAPPGASVDPAQASPVCYLRNYASFEHYFGTLPKTHRGDVRRQTKRLSDLGPVNLKVYAPAELVLAQEELGRMIPAYEAVWGQWERPHLFQSPGMVEFYQRMIQALLPVGLLHFSVLLLDKQPISWHFGFLHRSVFHYYKPTYSVRYENYSPGKVHLAHLMESGIQAGWRQFDFGAGVEEYKSRWTSDAVALKQLRWPTHTWRSRVFEALRRLKHGSG